MMIIAAGQSEAYSSQYKFVFKCETNEGTQIFDPEVSVDILERIKSFAVK